MTCEQAKEIPIVEFLESCDIHPKYIRGQDHWYLSPIREENTPSFKVNAKLNLFYDHGSGRGGDIIDLGRELFKCDTKALLEKLASGLLFFQPQQLKECVARIDQKVTLFQPAIHISSVKDLGNNLAIGRYLESRGIDLVIAKSYCREIYYRVGDKNYFAAGFENRTGGYELRNAYFKGSTFPKDLSHIENGHSSVCVLEGFMDFLSLLSLRKHEQIQTDFVVLNSVSLAERSLGILKNYSTVFLYPDHDAAGKKLVENLETAGLNCVDASGIYRGYKDLNQMLVASKQMEKHPQHQHRSRKSRGLGL